MLLSLRVQWAAFRRGFRRGANQLGYSPELLLVWFVSLLLALWLVGCASFPASSFPLATEVIDARGCSARVAQWSVTSRGDSTLLPDSAVNVARCPSWREYRRGWIVGGGR